MLQAQLVEKHLPLVLGQLHDLGLYLSADLDDLAAFLRGVGAHLVGVRIGPADAAFGDVGAVDDRLYRQQEEILHERPLVVGEFQRAGALAGGQMRVEFPAQIRLGERLLVARFHVFFGLVQPALHRFEIAHDEL